MPMRLALSAAPAAALRRAARLLLLLVATLPSAPGAAALSPRNASYNIDVVLDPAAKLLTARQIVTWRNLQDRPTRELWFHLYWNAWRNSRSTWMLEERLSGRVPREQQAEGDWGYCRIDTIRLLGAAGSEGVDLGGSWSFASPDDGNRDDRTVMVVSLPRPVWPGETIQLELAWRAKIPRTFARTGFRGDYYFIAHWFPKLGVFEGEGWNCRQFHAGTEFFSDYGVYEVSMTVPTGWVLGATGREVERADNGDGTTTHRYYQEDVHAFTWTVSPDFLDFQSRFEEPPLPPVDLRLLLQPEHLAQAERHFDATRAALRLYGSWFGPYPYGHLTIVDPAFGSDTGGMEYPTLFTSGTRLFNPFGGGSPEGVTIHEAGHQFWYGLVGNDEFAHAWIDEGLNTFSTARVYTEAYRPEFFVQRYFRPPGLTESGFFALPFPEILEPLPLPARRLDGYRAAATAVVQAEPTYRYFPPAGAQTSYSKTALWLGTLERHLGWDGLRRILSTFFERWSFRHPGPEDFLAVVRETADRDLDWFFDQVLSDRAFDYAIDSVESFPADPEGLVERGGDLVYSPAAGGETEIYRTEVVARRHGDGVFPVEVLLVFEDGSEVRRRWDGLRRWKLFVEERPARLDYAAVDPERLLLLDLDYTNNSLRREPRPGLPAVKWASKWMIWFQDLLAAFGFFV